MLYICFVEISLKNHLKLELQPEQSGISSLIVNIGPKSNLKSSFGEQCIQAAKQIAEQAAPDRVSILIDDTYESAVTVLAFLKAGVEFDLHYINFVNLRADLRHAYFQVKNWAEKLGLQAHPINLDFKNNEQLESLLKLQNSVACNNEDRLFKIWAACSIDNFLVLPGSFVLPVFSSSSISHWSLPGPDDLCVYKFFETFGGIPFFMSYSPDSIYSQAESGAAREMIRLLSAEKRVVNSETLAVKKLFAQQAFYKELNDLDIPENVEPIHVRALRSSGFHSRDIFYRIRKSFSKSKTKFLQNIEPSKETEINNLESINSGLFNLSERIDFRGNVFLESALTKDHEAYAAFPTLVTARQYKGNLNEILNYIQSLKFFKSETASATHGELHLHPAMKPFVDFVYESAELYFQEMNYVWDRTEIGQCWANRHTAGQRFDFHYHPNSFLSGVFYLTTGGSGNTLFKSQHRPQTIPITTVQNKWNPQQFESAPVAGKLLLFPSEMEHRTLPHDDSENPRYTLAFNLIYRGIKLDSGTN